MLSKCYNFSFKLKQKLQNKKQKNKVYQKINKIKTTHTNITKQKKVTKAKLFKNKSAKKWAEPYV